MPEVPLLTRKFYFFFRRKKKGFYNHLILKELYVFRRITMKLQKIIIVLVEGHYLKDDG